MKNLVLGSLIAIAASGLGGCVIEDDNSCPLESGNMTANWSIKSAATNTTEACPAGYPTAALYSQRINPDGSLVGQPIIDLFDCDCGTGTTQLDPGIYLAWIEIANDNNTAQFAKSASARVDLTNGGPASFNAQILEDGGYFMLTWGLTAKSNGAPLTCSQAGADGVSLIGTDVSNSSNSNEDVFTCDDHQGITAGYVQGTYTVSATALNAADQNIGETQTKTNAVIGDRNAFTDLGNVTIPIVGK
jgi:hypothetical protein